MLIYIIKEKINIHKFLTADNIQEILLILYILI